MKIRVNTLWKVPVFCAVASYLSFFVTVYLGGPFYTVETPEADGAVMLSVDPVRSALFSGGLFVIVLFLGGLWAFRSMTKVEIAVSAAILSAVGLAVVLAQLYLPGFPLALSMKLAYFQHWSSNVSTLLYKSTGNFDFSVIAANFSPFLFVPFGKKKN